MITLRHLHVKCCKIWLLWYYGFKKPFLFEGGFFVFIFMGIGRGGVNVVPEVNWEKIKQEYIENCKTVKLNYLAKKYGVKPGTLRSRKNRERWDDELTGRKERENVATGEDVATGKATQRKNVATDKQIEEYIDTQDLENSNLTEKQKLFCFYYVKYWNAKKAAIKAGYSKNYPAEIGHQLLHKTKVNKEIDRLKKQIRQGVNMEAMAVLQKYIDIAFADITDFTEFGIKELVLRGDKDGNPVTKTVNYVSFKDSSEVDGTIITEVKQGKDGVAIKLADKMKALEKLELYFDLLPDKWKRKLEEEKLEVQKKRLDIDDKDKTMRVVIVDDVPEGDDDATG